MRSHEPLLTTLAVALVSAALLVAAEPAEAQRRKVEGEVSLHLSGGPTVGPFAEHVEGLGGGGLSVMALFEAPLVIGARFDATWLLIGEDDVQVQIAPGLEADLTTKSTIAIYTLAPVVELTATRLRPFVEGSVGMAKFATTTTVAGGTLASPTDLGDWTLSLGVGGGVKFGGGVNPYFPEFAPMIELGALYVRHGQVQYLTEDRVRAAFDDGIPVEPVRSRGDAVLIRLRLTMGLRGGDFFR